MRCALPPSYSSVASGSASGTSGGGGTSSSIVRGLKRITSKRSMDNLEGLASDLGKCECYQWIIITIKIIIFIYNIY